MLKELIDKEIYENQRMTNIDIYINNTNNYTKWYFNDHVFTFMLFTLGMFQDDRSLLNADPQPSMY